MAAGHITLADREQMNAVLSLHSVFQSVQVPSPLNEVTFRVGSFHLNLIWIISYRHTPQKVQVRF